MTLSAVSMMRKILSEKNGAGYASVTAEEYGRVSKLGHTIEEDFRVAKSQCGLADYQVRNWYGWHHHITMSLIASWCLTQEVLCQKKVSRR